MNRLTKYCTKQFKISNRLAKTYLKAGKIHINGQIATSDTEVNPDTDRIDLHLVLPDLTFRSEDYILKQTDDMLFLYKPTAMHSERHTPEDPLTIQDIVKDMDNTYKMITRLDYGTDGVIAAVNPNLSIQHLSKTYLAAVHGVLNTAITLNNRIKASKRKKVHVSQEVGDFKTLIEPHLQYKDSCIVKVTLPKANRHQIRAYMAYLGHPIIGDALYGHGEDNRLMLHCLSTTINSLECLSGKESFFIQSL